MQVENLIEHEDGSATIQFNMTAEETRLLIESAIRIGLMKGLLMEETELDERMKEKDYERTDTAKRVTEWIGLTEEEVIASSAASTFMDELDAWLFATEIEAKLKEKNTCQD